MGSGITSWGASRRPDGRKPRSWAVRERPEGRPSLSLIPGLPLSSPWRGGRARCDVCGRRSRRLRVLHYRTRPWADAYRRLPAGAKVHYSCATIPDEPLELEFPRDQLLRLRAHPSPLPPVEAAVAPPERIAK